MRRYVLIIAVLIFASSALAVLPNEMPFGSYGMRAGVNFNVQLTDWDSLGFNIWYDRLTIAQMEQMGTAGITSIYMGNGSDAIAKFTNYNYALIEAEECGSPIRMYNCGGSFQTEGSDEFWVSASTDPDTLYGPNGFSPPCWTWCDNPNKYYIKMERKYPNGSEPEDVGRVINYQLEVKMRIDQIGTPEDVVAYLKLVCAPWDGVAVDTIPVGTITAGDFSGPDTWATVGGLFQIPEDVVFIRHDSTLTINGVGAIGVALLVETTGEREVSVDWLKVHDLKGQRLVETTEYDQQIENYASQYTSLADTLWGWYFRDEPKFTNFDSFAHIDSLVKYTYFGWHSFTSLNRWTISRSYLQRTNAEFFNQDYYPLGPNTTSPRSIQTKIITPDTYHAYLRRLLIEENRK